MGQVDLLAGEVQGACRLVEHRVVAGFTGFSQGQQIAQHALAADRAHAALDVRIQAARRGQRARATEQGGHAATTGAWALVVGGGPAGLFAAERARAAGLEVDLFEAKGSVGRKFLIAGKGGMNLTHSDPFDVFVTRYGERAHEAYNREVNGYFDGHRDYIVAHYKTNSRPDTAYWRADGSTDDE